MNTKLLATLTLLIFASCGGGGGDNNQSQNPQQNENATVTVLFDGTADFGKNGLNPVLSCNDKLFFPEELSSSHLKFSGVNAGSECYLLFYGENGNVIRTARKKILISTNSTVTLTSGWDLRSNGRIQLYPVEDSNNNTIADKFEMKKISNTELVETNKLERTVIFVMSADNIGSNSLTDFLKANYNDMVFSLEENGKKLKENSTRIVVLWDGNLDNGTNSDVFILEPKSSNDFSVIEPEMENILYGNGNVKDYTQNGIVLWYSGNGTRDMVSNNLKDILDLVLALYPANNFDLIMSGHGDGWTSFEPTQRAVIYESDGKGGLYWLGTKQFVNHVLKPLKEEENITFELLGFDECLMGELSTLSIMVPYADVFVASPDTEHAIGWGGTYQKVSDIFSKPDGWDIAKSIINEFKDYYTGEFLKYAPPSIYIMGLTAIKSSTVKEISEKFNQFAGSMKNSLNLNALYDYFCSTSPDFNSGNETPIMITIADFRKIDFSEDALNDDEISRWVEELENATLTAPLSFPSKSRFGFDPYYLAMDESLVAKAISLGSSFKDSSEIGFNYFRYPLNLDVYEAGKNLLSTLKMLSSDIYKSYFYLDGANKTYIDISNSSSGIYVIWPYVLPSSQIYKVSPCTYQNYVESYNSTMDNFTSFVTDVLSTWWEAANDTGLQVNCIF